MPLSAWMGKIERTAVTAIDPVALSSGYCETFGMGSSHHGKIPEEFGPYFASGLGKRTVGDLVF